MIGKSDLVILVVSAALLIAAIVRWQQNLNLLDAYNSASSSTQAPANTGSRTTQSGIVAVPGNVGQTGPSSQPDSGNQQNTNLAVNREPSTSGNNESADNAPATSSPTSNNAATQTGERNSASNELLFGIYVVEPGDYLFKIAQTTGTTVETLQRINNLPDTVINVGQQLRYPLPAN